MLSRVFLAISLVAASGVSAAIDFSSLPQCAQTPILNTIGRSKCDPSKPQCLCSDDVIVNDLVALIAKSCSGDDLTKAVGFGRALCPNLATQHIATISDPKTTFTITLDNPAGTSISVAPARATQTPTVLNVSPSTTETEEPTQTGAEEPTASVIAGNGANATSRGNGTDPEQFQGDAPEFGPMRLWSMVIGILMMGIIFSEL